MMSIMEDKERARGIVLLAMKKAPSAAEWLRMDERGKFEAMAHELLGSTAEKAARLGMTQEQVDNELAAYLGLQALDAMLRVKRIEAMDAVRTLVCVFAPLAVPVVIGAFGLKW